jgi:hypothetical protein
MQFLSILGDDPWAVLATAGPAAGTVDTTWVRDVSLGICGVTSLNARTTAGGATAEDTCKMTWKVRSGFGQMMLTFAETMIPSAQSEQTVG